MAYLSRVDSKGKNNSTTPIGGKTCEEPAECGCYSQDGSTYTQTTERRSPMTSSAERRRRNKGRRSGKSFVQMPHDLINHAAFTSLSPRAVKLLLDICAQYKGHNNGDLSATMSLMKTRGWSSNDQLFKARDELVDKNLIQVTRQGGLNRCTLYALTWFPINECGGKLDVAETRVARNEWRNWVTPECGAALTSLGRGEDQCLPDASIVTLQ